MRTASRPDFGLQSRVCVPIRCQGTLFGYLWLIDGDQSLTEENCALAEHCAAIGRDPAEIEHSTSTHRDGPSAADPFVDAGFTQFTLGVSGPDYDLSAIPAWVRWRDQRNGTAH